MPKVSRIPKFRKAALSEAPPSSLAESLTKNGQQQKRNSSKETNKASSDPASKAQLSRGQRKRLAKRDQYLKKERMIMSSLKLKRAEEQKKRIDGLDAIRDALLETVSKDKKHESDDQPEEKPNMLKSNRSRQKLVQQEVSQMNLVLQHPSFQADPFATIREHLQNTLAKDAQYQKKQAVKHAKERIEKQTEKIAAKKESGAKKKRKKFKATRSKSR